MIYAVCQIILYVSRVPGVNQENLTFEEYVNKFVELSRFGPELVSTPLKKNEKFIKGMKEEYQKRMTAHVMQSFWS